MVSRQINTAACEPSGRSGRQSRDWQRFFLLPTAEALGRNSVESNLMRLYQQIRASIARPAVIGAAALLFASGIPLSAFGQTQRASQAPATPSSLSVSTPPQGSPLGIDEAVKM